MSWIWGEGLGGARPVAAVSLQAEISGRASIESGQKPGCPDPFRVGTSDALTLVSDRPRRSSDVSWGIPTLKGSGHPSWRSVFGSTGSGLQERSVDLRPPPTPVEGGWPKAGRGISESSQRIRGPEARSKRAVRRLDWANAQPSTVSPSRPVAAPSPKSEILVRATVENWFIPTLKGSGHPCFRSALGSPWSGLRQPTLSLRPPPAPVGGGWPKAGRGQSESSQRIRGPQARSKQAVVKLDWANAQPSTVSPSRPVGAPSPKSEIWWRESIEGLLWAAPPRLSPTLPETSSERALKFPTLKGSGHPGWAFSGAQTRVGGWR